MRPMSAFVTARALALLLGVLSCKDDGVSATSLPPEPIIAGQDDLDDPAVMALVAKDVDDEWKIFCSAVLVSPTVLLTAAHCVHPAILSPALPIYVRGGQYPLTAPNTPDLPFAHRFVDPGCI